MNIYICVLFEIININLTGKSYVGLLCSVNLPFWRWTRNSLGELLVGRGGCSMSLLSFSPLVFGGEGQHCNFPGNARKGKTKRKSAEANDILSSFFFVYVKSKWGDFATFFLVAQKKNPPRWAMGMMKAVGPISFGVKWELRSRSVGRGKRSEWLRRNFVVIVLLRVMTHEKWEIIR